MSINYVWDFNPLEVYPSSSEQSQVVFNVHWQVYAETGSAGTEDYYRTGRIGVQSISYDSGSVFIPYSELTKDIVFGWVTSSMGSDYDKILTDLSNRIEEKINPPVLKQSPPWSI